MNFPGLRSIAFTLLLTTGAAGVGALAAAPIVAAPLGLAPCGRAARLPLCARLTKRSGERHSLARFGGKHGADDEPVFRRGCSADE